MGSRAPSLCLISEARYVKELHGSIIRSGLSVSNVVLGNALINMYVKLGVFNYAFRVFSQWKSWMLFLGIH